MRIQVYMPFGTAEFQQPANVVHPTSEMPSTSTCNLDEPPTVVTRFAYIAPVGGQWVLHWEQTTRLLSQAHVQVETGSIALHVPERRVREARNLARSRLRAMGWEVEGVQTEAEAEAARACFVGRLVIRRLWRALGTLGSQ